MSVERNVKQQEEVKTFLARLNYAIKDKHSKVKFIENRKVDIKREIIYTNKFALPQLFPDEDPTKALRNELAKLTEQEYLYSLPDTRFPHRVEWNVFARKYEGYEEYVYIKVRVLLIDRDAVPYILIMSFHFSDQEITIEDFPFL